MFNFKSLRCFHCNSVVLNLPEAEILKLNGLNLLCECCGHQNLLEDSQFTAGNNQDPMLSHFNIESLVSL